MVYLTKNGSIVADAARPRVCAEALLLMLNEHRRIELNPWYGCHFAPVDFSVPLIAVQNPGKER